MAELFRAQRAGHRCPWQGDCPRAPRFPPQVEPFASLAGAVRSSVPRVLINRELVGPFAWQQRHNDVAQLGDVVGGVEKLVELLGWSDEMQTLIQKEKEKVGRGSEPQLPPQPLRSLCWSYPGQWGVCACWGRTAQRSAKKPQTNPNLSAVSQPGCQGRALWAERVCGRREDMDLPVPDELGTWKRAGFGLKAVTPSGTERLPATSPAV